MFVFAASLTADRNPQPAQPVQAAEPRKPATNPNPEPSAQLLTLLHGLITFGWQMLRALGRNPDAQLLTSFVGIFRNRDIGLILARIIRGLRMAQALEQRILRNARRIDNPRFSLYVPRPPVQPGPPIPDQPAPPATPEDLLSTIPSVEELARQIRHRQIGAVLADICQDLGIRPGHPDWHKLCTAIVRHHGNFLRFLEATVPIASPAAPSGASAPQPRIAPAAPQRSFTPPFTPAPAPADPQGAAAASTGPP